jgi:hypothetical protein
LEIAVLENQYAQIIMAADTVCAVSLAPAATSLALLFGRQHTAIIAGVPSVVRLGLTYSLHQNPTAVTFAV